MKPKKMILPTYFDNPRKTVIVPSFFEQLDFYEAQRPVKAESSKLNQEKERLRDDNAR